MSAAARLTRAPSANRLVMPMLGLHLTADLFGCAADQPAMTEADALAAICIAAVRGQSLTIVGECWHGFAQAPDGSPGGVTGVLLLAESHLAVHTWPERGQVTLDVFVCNHGADHSERAECLLAELVQRFAPQRHDIQRLRRGEASQTQASPP